MPVFNNALAGAAGQSGGADAYKIERSLRFNSSDSAYLSRTPSSIGNTSTWTFSCWVKRTKFGVYPRIFGTYDNSYIGWDIEFNNSDQIDIHYSSTGSNYPIRRTTTAKYRDPGAWMHVVVAVDLTVTGDNSVRLWVNGLEVTAFDTKTNSSSITTTNINTATQHRIGYNYHYSDFYLADVHFLDGTAISNPDGVFGEFDANTGVWNPIEFTGTHNTAGLTHWRQADSSDAPSGDNNAQNYRTQRAFEDPQPTALVWDHQATETIGLQNITGVTSLRLKLNSVGNAKLAINGGALFSVGNHGTSTSYPPSESQASWYTISNPPSTLTSISATGGGSGTGNWASVWAIEVNGNRVVDTTAGINGFHLDFSDDSTQAALGTDASGNNNTWLVYNLTHTGTIYQNNGSITVNNGRTDSVGSFAAVFNGTNNANAANAYGFSSGAMDFTWNLDTPIPFTSQLRVWTGYAGGTVHLNGDSTGVASVNNNYTTLATSSGTLSSIRFVVGSGGGWWSSVLLDGNMLVSGVPTDFDSLLDSPTNYEADNGNIGGNYATFNALDSENGTLSNGNLTTNQTNTSVRFGPQNTTIGVSSGKWYCEFTWDSGTYALVGITHAPSAGKSSTTWHRDADTYTWYFSGAFMSAAWPGTSTFPDGSNPTFTVGDIVGVLLDKDNDKLYFTKNGSYVASMNAATGANGIDISAHSGKTAFITCGNNASTATQLTLNAGQRPFAASSIPTGFKSLCTQNLDDPLIAKSSDHFEAKLYDGNGSSQTISTDVSPDLVWVKRRNSSVDHVLFDSVRGFGANKELTPNEPYIEGGTGSGQPNTDVWGYVDSATSNGFVVEKGSHSTGSSTNTSGGTYVGWVWDAGSAFSNSAGSNGASIASSGKANTTAGFSIVEFTGPSSAGFQGVYHGLNAKPEFIICKDRDNARNWSVYHKDSQISDVRVLPLNQNVAAFNSGTATWDISEINSNIFTPYFRDDYGASYSADNIAYCWHSRAGFSQFGSYSGNGNPDGPFVYTGFRPRWVLIRNVSATNSWAILDTARDTFNGMDERLHPDTYGQTNTGAGVVLDVLSNGFKCRNSDALENGSGNTIIYAAFAENPFKIARAR